MTKLAVILTIGILELLGIWADTDKVHTRSQLLRLCGVPEYLGEDAAKTKCLSCIEALNLDSYDKNAGVLPQGLADCFQFLPKSFRSCPNEEKPKECTINTFKRFMASVKKTFLERWKDILTKTEKEQFQEVRAMKYLLQVMKDKFGQDNQLIASIRQCWMPNGNSPSPSDFEEDDGISEFMKRSVRGMDYILDNEFDFALTRAKRVARPKSKEEVKNELTRNHFKLQFEILRCAVYKITNEEQNVELTKEFLSSFTGNVPVELVRALFMKENLAPR